MLESLPENILYEVLFLLDYNDLISLSLVNQRVRRIVQSCDAAWRDLCIRYWVISQLPDVTETWKQQFMQMHLNWGRYVKVYAPIRRAWNQIMEFTKEYAPRVHQSCLSGLSDSELDDLEAHLGFRLPLDVRCSYRMVNGQRMCASPVVGLFGGYGEGHSADFLMPLRGRYHGEFRIVTELPGCLPLVRCSAEGVPPLLLAARACPDQHIPQGWIFSACSASHENLRALHHLNIFLFAPSFLDLLVTHAQTIQSRSVHYGGGIMKYMPNSTGRTGPFSVTVETAFIREASFADTTPCQFAHSYHITICMDKDAPTEASCQLETRHWELTDENGHVEIVDGPGVVGEFPILRPGVEFDWFSAAAFPTPSGHMVGHFRMRNLVSSIPVDILCPTFCLRTPRLWTSEQRTALWDSATMSLRPEITQGSVEPPIETADRNNTPSSTNETGQKATAS